MRVSELGPTDRQIRTCTEISPFGRQVFRNERALDDLLEREGFPGFVQLWRFILDFSVSKLDRGLDYYFGQWLDTDPSRKARNHPFLHCSDTSESTKDLAILNESDFTVTEIAPAVAAHSSIAAIAATAPISTSATAAPPSHDTTDIWSSLIESKRQELKRTVTLRSSNERFLRIAVENMLPGGVKVAEDLWQRSRYTSPTVRILLWKSGTSTEPAVVLIKFATADQASLVRKHFQDRPLSSVTMGPSNEEASLKALSAHPEWLTWKDE